MLTKMQRFYTCLFFLFSDIERDDAISSCRSINRFLSSIKENTPLLLHVIDYHSRVDACIENQSACVRTIVSRAFWPRRNRYAPSMWVRSRRKVSFGGRHLVKTSTLMSGTRVSNSKSGERTFASFLREQEGKGWERKGPSLCRCWGPAPW